MTCQIHKMHLDRKTSRKNYLSNNKIHYQIYQSPNLSFEATIPQINRTKKLKISNNKKNINLNQEIISHTKSIQKVIQNYSWINKTLERAYIFAENKAQLPKNKNYQKNKISGFQSRIREQQFLLAIKKHKSVLSYFNNKIKNTQKKQYLIRNKPTFQKQLSSLLQNKLSLSKPLYLNKKNNKTQQCKRIQITPWQTAQDKTKTVEYDFLQEL